MNEQRTLPRWKTKKQVSVRMNENRYSNCVLEDINTRGMCVDLPQRLSKAGLVNLGMELEDGTLIDLNVQVPWVKKMVGYYKHGLVFYKSAEESDGKINKLVLDSITKS